MSESWPWLTLALLGAYHGINPAMGWLFAVARGLQEKSRTAVLQALLPITLGHGLSIGLFILVINAAQLVTAPNLLRVGAAITLVLFGAYKFFAPHSHPRWVGMRVSRSELVLWSFLMASAHGAGLMLLPVLFALAPAEHGSHTGASSGSMLALDGGAIAVHMLAMLVVMAAVAIVVYEKVGLAILRRAWINFDAVWAVTIVVAGLLTLFTA